TGHWLLIRCVGTRSNRSAIGARVTLHAGALEMTREIIAGSSYLSNNDVRVHFGLGKYGYAEWLRIRWPSGLVERINNIKADQIVSIEEGKATTTSFAKAAGQ
ncbi:MAG: ASPIC/UnbV domain-containing protein, partial [Candidatus Acidiferrales bacterium]